MQIKKNLERIRTDIEKALEISNRSSKDLLLLPITKYQNEQTLFDLLKLGFNEFGESQVQTLLKKDEILNEEHVQWHFVGHLQTNKVKYLGGKVKLIHSVDSPKLIEKLANESNKQDILLQINVSGERTKYGFSKEECCLAVEKVLKEKNLNLSGLMTMAPKDPSIMNPRECFAKLYNLRESLETQFSIKLKELSMGMSLDFKEAILEGSTILRIGSSLFTGLV